MKKYFDTKSAAAAMAAAITGIATVAGSIAVAAGPAWADGTTTTTATTAPGTSTVPVPPHVANRLAWVKENSAQLIAHRVASLDKAIATVETKAFLGSDQVALETEMQGSISGLQALGAKIQSDTDLETALHDRAAIFTQYRVYFLVLPTVHDVIRADWYINFELPAINGQIAQIQAQENSANQAVLGPLVTGMQSQVGIVTSAISGLNAQLLAFTPSQWNSNHRLLLDANNNLRLSARAITVAERDNAEARRYLKTGHTTPKRKAHGEEYRGH